MLNIHRVLFPTDFSDGSKQAFPQAAYLADWHDAELRVLNVTGRHRHDYSEAKEHFPIPVDTLTDWLHSPSGDAAQGQWPNLNELSLIQEQIESAAPAEEIVEYSEEEDIDLVVMGTHGRRGVDRMLFGSVTEEVVRKASCPAFTVRTGAEVAPGQAVRRVLVPIDFSDASEVALQHAKEIALTYGAEIDLLHVVEEPFHPPVYEVKPSGFHTQEVIDRVEKQLGDMAREDIGYEHVMVQATAGYPPHEILDYIDENEVDLTVVATHGRTGLDRIVLGSVAERVLRQSPKPVFVVKPGRTSLLPSASADATAGE